MSDFMIFVLGMLVFLTIVLVFLGLTRVLQKTLQKSKYGERNIIYFWESAFCLAMGILALMVGGGMVASIIKGMGF